LSCGLLLSLPSPKANWTNSRNVQVVVRIKFLFPNRRYNIFHSNLLRVNQMVAHYQTKVRTFDVHFLFQFLHPTPITKFVGGTYVDRIFWKWTQKKPITKHKTFYIHFLFHFYTLHPLPKCDHMWTMFLKVNTKKPITKQGQLNPWCFTPHTYVVWGTNVNNLFFLMCRKKTLHQIG
jgi:hypothetical protein